ncbi:hypothetical protein NEMBOFW57_001215 [Staphylotrichum longicolle]|uniref:Uncharacterized protein n=1 Tax=Staphylotrichum longicolle TaxID=669026 RepID=A0AAD4F5L6_9PEZI|nr:hypothetical protein NEMBOFW57_001215 [Staphylotrichum longicolle]
MVATLNTTIDSIWVHYSPNLLVTHLPKDKLLGELLLIDDSHWDGFPSAAEIETGASTDVRYQTFIDKVKDLKVTVLDSILQSCNLVEIEDIGWQDHPSTYERDAYKDALERFNLVVCTVPPSLRG